MRTCNIFHNGRRLGGVLLFAFEIFAHKKAKEKTEKEKAKKKRCMVNTHEMCAGEME